MVRVPEPGGEVGPVVRLVRCRVLCGIVKPVTLDDPLGTDAYVLAKETLQHALTRPRKTNDVIDLGDLAIVGDGVHDAKDGLRVRIALGHPRSNACLRLRNHRRVVLERENRLLPFAV